MFRLEAELELLTADKGLPLSVPEISLRGYNKETPIAVTGQFIEKKPLAVGDIIGFCPVHRDLYLRKICNRKDPDKSQRKSWARLAGPVIEECLKYAYEFYKKKRGSSAVGAAPAQFRKKASKLLDTFLKTKEIREQIDRLNKRVASRYDLQEDDLRLLLFNTVVKDLFYLQGALNYVRVKGSGKGKALRNLVTKIIYTPEAYIKISPDSTPDLLLPKFGAIGDIKSGQFRDNYFLSVAGYALGYESAFKTDMNLGVIYLVETANDCIRSSRTLVFWITDELRKRFLDRRDRAFATLYESGEAPIVLTNEEDISEYCSRCAFCNVCHDE